MPPPVLPLRLKYRPHDAATRRIQYLCIPIASIQAAWDFLQTNPTTHLAHIYTNTRPQRYITRLESNAPLSDFVRQKWP